MGWSHSSNGLSKGKKKGQFPVLKKMIKYLFNPTVKQNLIFVTFIGLS